MNHIFKEIIHHFNVKVFIFIKIKTKRTQGGLVVMAELNDTLQIT